MQIGYTIPVVNNSRIAVAPVRPTAQISFTTPQQIARVQNFAFAVPDRDIPDPAYHGKWATTTGVGDNLDVEA